MQKGRDINVDIVKGMAIIFMVMGHAGVPFTRFIYLFHMPVFFIASGYCFKEKYSESFGNFFPFLKKRLIRLWLPYVIFNTIYSILNNFFIDVNFYSADTSIYQYINDYDMGQTPIFSRWTIGELFHNILKTLFFSGSTEIGGALWFLAVLFETSVLFAFINTLLSKIFSFILKNNIEKVRSVTILLQFIFSIIFLGAGFYLSRRGIFLHFFQTDLSVYSLYFMGYLLKTFSISSREKSIVDRVGIIILSFLSLLILENFVNIQLLLNSYGNPLYLIASSFLGWEFLYELSALIKLTKLKQCLLVAGQNTLFILSLHFLVFKVINLVLVEVHHLPKVLTAVFPVLFSGGGYWILYSGFGVVIPIILSILWGKLKHTFLKPKKA